MSRHQKGMPHQYVDRRSGRVITERLAGDRMVRWIYAVERENPAWLFNALVSPRMSDVLAFLNFDARFFGAPGWCLRFCKRHGLNVHEFLEPPTEFKTLREFFERKIKYWLFRPMPREERAVVSPADSRVLLGSFSRSSRIFSKEKFFVFDELFGVEKREWLDAFRGGDFAVFRLTPDKYHYSHTPVAGRILDFYPVPGCHHSCNPDAVVTVATPFSKNQRVVTILDTDVTGGTGVGLVAMIEIVALMIGEVVQRYSDVEYRCPRPVEKGMFLERGVPKSLYRPGSSTDVLVFQKGRVSFAEDLLRNMSATGVQSRYSLGFGQPLVETDLQVRSLVAMAAEHEN